MRKRRYDSILVLSFFSALLISALAWAVDAQQSISIPDAPPAVTVTVAESPISVKPVPKTTEKWLKRQEAINARIKQGNVDLIFLGDSITNNWEGNGKEVWNKYYEKRNAANLGIGGDQTQHVLWRLDNGNIDGISPKLAIVMIGTNNAGAGQKPEDIATGVKAIVEKLRNRLPQTKILLLAIFPRGGDDQDPKREAHMKAHEINTKTNEIIAKYADDKMIFYLDINDKFLDPDHKLTKEIMPDFLHPNAKGYEIWAEAIEPTVARLMGDK